MNRTVSCGVQLPVQFSWCAVQRGKETRGGRAREDAPRHSALPPHSAAPAHAGWGCCSRTRPRRPPHLRHHRHRPAQAVLAQLPHVHAVEQHCRVGRGVGAMQVGHRPCQARCKQPGCSHRSTTSHLRCAGNPNLCSAASPWPSSQSYSRVSRRSRVDLPLPLGPAGAGGGGGQPGGPQPCQPDGWQVARCYCVALHSPPSARPSKCRSGTGAAAA